MKGEKIESRGLCQKFNNEMRWVTDIDYTIASAVFINGLRDKDFTKSLTKKLPKVFTNLLPRAKKCTNAKEVDDEDQSHDQTVEREKDEEPSSKRSPRQNF